MLHDENKPDYDLVEKPRKRNSKAILSIVITAILGFLNFGKLAVIGKLLFTLLKASKFAGTFITMGLTALLYAQIYGWLFAVGFVGVIFIHEMGHYVTSKKLGLDVSAPTFIPFLGAFIRMKSMPNSVREEAITAIGGPAAGALITFVCLGLYMLTSSPYWAGLAYVSAFINLFNLLPFGSLDGGRISKAISPFIWVIGLVMALFLIWKLHAYILLIIVLFGAYEVLTMYRQKSVTAQYLSVEPSFRLKIGISYLVLIGVLVFLMMYSLDISKTFTESIYGLR
ncbi:site-2 protease family protein [Desulfosporosinus sp.]|uniref:site-2 protease family protein n=1 Tax=Desulfosporosinus sp. TaxID=157907 RepID=UPI000E845F6C|nr:site-2 protease family protein [Desulfosporosinus sp.]MBC2723170.1 site-2 protease family protein [Desulfosporosinus sp.]MBC2726534.1 site-2 protease family protein [Desulfosporosinus sp.]HBV87434.1 site-2 protease family protein [Desulfosporosinus sp.]